MCFMLCAQHVFCVFYVLGEAGMFWSILHCAIVHLCIWQFSYSDFAHFASTFFIVHWEYISSLHGVNCVHISRAWESMIFWQVNIRCPTTKMSKILQWQKCWGRCTCFSTFGAIELRKCWWWWGGGYCFCRCRALRQASLWEACMCHNLKMQHSCCTMWSLWKQQNTYQLT